MKSFSIIFVLVFPCCAVVSADDSFGEYDTNGDEMVTYEELARSKKLEFDKLDRNRDRAVSIEEFTILNEEPPTEFDFFHSANFETPEGARAISLLEYGEQIRLMINRLDTTADNAVSREEYAAAVAEAKQEAADSLAPKVRKGSGPKR